MTPWRNKMKKIVAFSILMFFLFYVPCYAACSKATVDGEIIITGTTATDYVVHPGKLKVKKFIWVPSGGDKADGDLLIIEADNPAGTDQEIFRFECETADESMSSGCLSVTYKNLTIADMDSGILYILLGDCD